MPKRGKASKAEAAAENGEAAAPAAEPTAEAAAAGEDKPQPKKRKLTKKQQEAAEAAARPVYDESQRPPPPEGPAIRIVTWNVVSLNSTLTKDPAALSRLAEQEQADVLCLQETKLQEGAVEAAQERLGLPGWACHWSCSTARKGYSGTATLSRTQPLSVSVGMGKGPDFDSEGRLITTEHDSFFLVNVYTPNSGEGLKRLQYRTEQWDRAFAGYLAELQARKPVIVTGDLNCAHRPIDIHSPGTNKKSAGFTQEERDSFGANLEQLRLVDCFRRQYPDTVGYTYWSMRAGARAKNKGWRLDYFLASEALVDRLHDCSILKSYQEDAKLSDHCPIGLVLKL